MSLNVNNIYLGSAYELIKELPDKSVDLIITDPPYNRQEAEVELYDFDEEKGIYEL